MAHYDHGLVLPFVAGSAVGQGVAVKMPIASSRNEVVIPAAAVTDDLVGLTIATQATYGYEVAVLVSGVGKARAAASVGAGAKVGVASTNGALGPVLASGTLASFGASAGLQPARYVVGRALTAAAAGEYFAVLLDPAEIV